MEKKSFTTSFLVDRTPKVVFNAINDVTAWWPGVIEGKSDKLNAEFTYRYKELHYSKQKVVDFILDKKVVWLVTESSLNFVDEKDEWTGTKIVFEIAEKGKKTEVRFTHQGLVPQFECYDACSNAWSDIIINSMRNFIMTGKGESEIKGAPA
jgi:hypothetical protein